MSGRPTDAMSLPAVPSFETLRAQGTDLFFVPDAVVRAGEVLAFACAANGTPFDGDVSANQLLSVTPRALIDLAESDQQASRLRQIFRYLNYAQTQLSEGSLPSQTGNATRSLVTNGTITAWTPRDAVAVSSVSSLKALDVSNHVDRQVFNTSGYYLTGDQGHGTYQYNATATTPDNGGSVIAPTSGAGRYFLLTENGQYSIRQWGATGLGIAFDTAAIQAALDSGIPLYAPPGTYKITTLEIPSYATLIGAGPYLTKFKSTVTGTTAIFKRKTSAVTGTYYVTLSQFLIEGEDGSGGTGLWLDSFRQGTFRNLRINLCRNAADTGRGLYMENSLALCVWNTFYNLQIENCDDALTMESTNATYTTGYNHFFGLIIYQEKRCIRLMSTLSGGGVYNYFSGVGLQGSLSGTELIWIEGSGNMFDGIVYDGTLGTQKCLVFNPTANSTCQGNFVRWQTGFNASATNYTNGNVSGIPNTVTGAANFSYSPGKPYQFVDPIGGVEIRMTGALVNSGVDLYFGNATRFDQWRWNMQSNAAPFLQLIGKNATDSDTKLYIASGTVGNLGLLGIPSSAGAGQRLLFLRDCLAEPTTTPVGGMFIYSLAGVLKVKGADGVNRVVTVV